MQAATIVALFSVLIPVKTWFGPSQPISVTVKPPDGQQVVLVLTDFTGKPIEAAAESSVEGERTVDLKKMFPQILTPATYVLWAVPPGQQAPRQFVGTPLVIQVRADQRRDAAPGPMVVRIEPLSFAVMSTDKGDATIAFFYDGAPHTVSNFVSLSRGGYYDDMPFHRIVPGFVVQAGDPRGDGTGGPGYTIDAEFNDREHREGVLSMARQGDPLESQGAPPRPEFANTAGSQFFICLNYERTKQLDRRYTAFGRVVDGMPTITAIAANEVNGDRPVNPPVIKTVKIFPVEPGKNPYELLMQSALQAREGADNRR